MLYEAGVRYALKKTNLKDDELNIKLIHDLEAENTLIKRELVEVSGRLAANEKAMSDRREKEDKEVKDQKAFLTKHVE